MTKRMMSVGLSQASSVGCNENRDRTGLLLVFEFAF